MNNLIKEKEMNIAKINECWFDNNHKIVPKMSEQYLLKKDLTIGDCNYPSGMVVSVKSYCISQEYYKLDLKINTQSIPEDRYPLLYDNLNSLIITFYDGNDYSKKISEFYDYFEELDKDMTLDDLDEVKDAMDDFKNAVHKLNVAIDRMEGDSNCLIANEYPLGLSYEEWVLSMDEWFDSVDDNVKSYKNAITTVRKEK
jgi:hypothetical protein